MKSNLKAIAAAVAMISMAGAAQAAIVTENTNNGNFVLTAFNQVTKAWYMRDLGFTINTFLPTGVNASVGDPSSGLVGNSTPAAGLTLDKNNTTSFGSTGSWATWIAGQVLSDIRWNVTAVDPFTSGAANGVGRLLVSSANATETSSNGQLTNFTNSSNAGSAQSYFNPAQVGISASNTGAIPYQDSLDDNFGLGSDGLAMLDQGVGLFYFARSTQTGGSPNPANGGTFQNSTNVAVVTLEADGDFSYILGGPVAAVPLPAAAWMLGAGLLALGGAVRRRRAADAA